MKKLETRLSQSKLLYIIASLAMNMAAVVAHELGHALVYIVQGIRIHLTLVSAGPLNGPETIPGLLGGFIGNASVAFFFLLLYLHSRKLIYFLVVLANTFFVRILFYLFAFLTQSFPNDEIRFARAWHTEPRIISLIGLGIMLAILCPALYTLCRHTNRIQKRTYLSLSLLGSILSFLGFAVLESAYM